MLLRRERGDDWLVAVVAVAQLNRLLTELKVGIP